MIRVGSEDGIAARERCQRVIHGIEHKHIVVHKTELVGRREKRHTGLHHEPVSPGEVHEIVAKEPLPAVHDFGGRLDLGPWKCLTKPFPCEIAPLVLAEEQNAARAGSR